MPLRLLLAPRCLVPNPLPGRHMPRAVFCFAGAASRNMCSTPPPGATPAGGRREEQEIIRMERIKNGVIDFTTKKQDAERYFRGAQKRPRPQSPRAVMIRRANKPCRLEAFPATQKNCRALKRLGVPVDRKPLQGVFL